MVLVELIYPLRFLAVISLRTPWVQWFQEHFPDADRLDAVSRTVALSYAQHLKHQVDAGQYSLRYQRDLYTSIRQFFDFVIDEGLETAPERNPFSFRDVPGKPRHASSLPL